MQRGSEKQHGGERNDQAVRVHAGQILLVLQLAVLPADTKTASTTRLGSLVLLARRCFARCFYHIFGVPLRHSAHGNQRNDRGGTRPGNNQNEISISIIPTSEFFPSHRKMFVIASQPAVNHLTPVVA